MTQLMIFIINFAIPLLEDINILYNFHSSNASGSVADPDTDPDPVGSVRYIIRSPGSGSVYYLALRIRIQQL